MVCDDGSTDETVGILEEYAYTRGLLYQVNRRNLGYIKNFEKIISLCSGDYIALCDQDDCWHPDKLRRLVDGLGRYSLICSDAGIIDHAGNKIADSYRKYKCIHIPQEKNKPVRFFSVITSWAVHHCFVEVMSRLRYIHFRTIFHMIGGLRSSHP
jgi:glycosyltransferase involved in cell wall biosynthesis